LLYKPISIDKLKIYLLNTTLLFIGPLTYVLGAAAGFFTFAGISLIAREYQMESGTPFEDFSISL
jgi:hypothetical protein